MSLHILARQFLRKATNSPNLVVNKSCVSLGRLLDGDPLECCLLIQAAGTGSDCASSHFAYNLCDLPPYTLIWHYTFIRHSRVLRSVPDCWVWGLWSFVQSVVVVAGHSPPGDWRRCRWGRSSTPSPSPHPADCGKTGNTWGGSHHTYRGGSHLACRGWRGGHTKHINGGGHIWYHSGRTVEGITPSSQTASGVWWQTQEEVTTMIVILNLRWSEFVEMMSDVSICFCRSWSRIGCLWLDPDTGGVDGGQLVSLITIHGGAVLFDVWLYVCATPVLCIAPWYCSWTQSAQWPNSVHPLQ